MPRRTNARAVRKHRNYTVEEVANVVDVAKGTVRRWMKSGLPALTDKRRALILGCDLIAFLNASKPKQQRCAVEECFCSSCRRPRKPAFGEAELISARGGSARFWALCEACGTEMHKAISRTRLPELEARVTVSNGPDHEPISGC